MSSPSSITGPCFACKETHQLIFSLHCKKCQQVHSFCELTCCMTLDSEDHPFPYPPPLSKPPVEELTDATEKKVHRSLAMISTVGEPELFRYFYRMLDKCKHLYGFDIASYSLVIVLLLDNVNFKSLNLFLSGCIFNHIERKEGVKTLLDRVFGEVLFYVFLWTVYLEGDKEKCLHACMIIEKMFKFDYQPPSKILTLQKEGKKNPLFLANDNVTAFVQLTKKKIIEEEEVKTKGNNKDEVVKCK